MARIKIPGQFIKGTKLLALLNEESFEEVLSALRSVSPKMYRQELSKILKPLIKSINVDDVSEISYSAFGLHLGRVSSKLSIDDFVENVVSDLLEDTSGPKLSESQRIETRNRLSKILSVRSLSIGAKAQRLLFEHEKNLTGARIVTDLRPVFGDKVADGPAALIIIHELKLSYLEGSEIKDVFFAMDTKDLQVLMDVLERAKQKNETLKSLVTSANLPCIQAE